MIDLHPVSLEDKSWIDPIVWAESSSSADFNFGNIYLWDNTFRQMVGRLGDRCVVMPCYDEKPFFAFPVGSGELAPVLHELETYARAKGFPFVLGGVTGHHLPLLEAIYPGRCTVRCDRAWWDYIYSAEKLATLSGKHLHGKRNHINRFEAENNWTFTALCPADFPACMALLDKWLAENPEDMDTGATDEYVAIRRAFADYEALGMRGGILRVDGTPVGFTMGEPVCEHTFVVHFEKACADINGAYPMVNRQFVRMIRAEFPAIQWINREDDMGHESLRQSKESYHPDHMVEKYTVVINDG